MARSRLTSLPVCFSASVGALAAAVRTLFDVTRGLPSVGEDPSLSLLCASAHPAALLGLPSKGSLRPGYGAWTEHSKQRVVSSGAVSSLRVGRRPWPLPDSRSPRFPHPAPSVDHLPLAQPW